MPLPWLDESEISDIQEKAVQVGLHNKRDYLLNDLPISLSDTLEESESGEAQLLSDLKHLNQTPPLAGDLIPLAVWLENAADHAAGHPSTREFFTQLADRVALSDHDELKGTVADSNAPVRSTPSFTTRGGPPSGPEATRGGPSALEAARGGPPSGLRAIRGLPPDVAELDLDTVNERHIFTNDLLPIGFLSRANSFGKSVCRLLVTRFENGRRRVSLTGRTKRYFGTGWLIGTGHVITNHHVVNGRDPGEPDAPQADLVLQSKSTVVQFDFDTEDTVPEEHTVAELAHANKPLDYAILKLSGDSGQRAVPLWSQEVDLSGEEVIPVNIIQHPGSTPKQIGMRNNLVAKVTERNLAYFTDTKGGSSGSPVCNDVWQVVALHKAATRTFGVLEFQGKETQWVNIGTRIDLIIADLKTNQPDLWSAIRESLDATHDLRRSEFNTLYLMQVCGTLSQEALLERGGSELPATSDAPQFSASWCDQTTKRTVRTTHFNTLLDAVRRNAVVLVEVVRNDNVANTNSEFALSVVPCLMMREKSPILA